MILEKAVGGFNREWAGVTGKSALADRQNICRLRNYHTLQDSGGFIGEPAAQEKASELAVGFCFWISSSLLHHRTWRKLVDNVAAVAVHKHIAFGVDINIVKPAGAQCGNHCR